VFGVVTSVLVMLWTFGKKQPRRLLTILQDRVFSEVRLADVWYLLRPSCRTDYSPRVNR
jgi:hypothetical protein